MRDCLSGLAVGMMHSAGTDAMATLLRWTFRAHNLDQRCPI